MEIAEVNKFERWNAWDILIDHDFDMHRLFSSGAASLHYARLQRVMRAETTKQMAIAAIALKRYQLKHGNYPPDLNSLVPEFVSKVPLDPVDGQPLRYRRNRQRNISALFRRRKRQGRRRQSGVRSQVSSLQIIIGKTLMPLTGSGRSRRQKRKFRITTRIRQNNGSGTFHHFRWGERTREPALPHRARGRLVSSLAPPNCDSIELICAFPIRANSRN